MKNLKEETLEAIINSGHAEEDVMFVGSADGKYRLSIEEFKKLSNFSYDNGYGGQEIAKDLIIYFHDKTYIVRGEYDGSEWWKYNVAKVFSANDESSPYHLVKNGNSWDSLEEMNSSEEEN